MPGPVYRKVDWKYVLEERYSHTFLTPVFPRRQVVTILGQDYKISDFGVAFNPGFGWDGASGPTIDTENSMRAALVHDVLCRAIAEGKLPWRPFRRRADREFRRILRQDGMSWLRRWIWWAAVRGYARLTR